MGKRDWFGDDILVDAEVFFSRNACNRHDNIRGTKVVTVEAVVDVDTVRKFWRLFEVFQWKPNSFSRLEDRPVAEEFPLWIFTVNSKSTELWVLRSATSEPDGGSSDSDDSVVRIISWSNRRALPVLFGFLFVHGKGVADILNLEAILIINVGVDEVARDAGSKCETWRLRNIQEIWRGILVLIDHRAEGGEGRRVHT
jgi:hypothetical protein